MGNLRTSPAGISRQQVALLLRRPLPTYRRAAVVVMSGEGSVVAWSAAAERLYGWTAAEAMGRSVLRFRPAPNVADKAAELLAYLQAGHPWIGKINLRKRNGLPLQTFVMAYPVGDLAHGGGLIVSIGVPARQRQLVELHRGRIEAELQLRARGVQALRLPNAKFADRKRGGCCPQPRADVRPRYASISPIRRMEDMHDSLPHPTDGWRLMQRIETYRHRAELVAREGRSFGLARAQIARMWRRLAADLHAPRG